MDRSPSSAPQHPTAMRTAGSATLDLLLSAAAGERGEPASAPPARPTLHEAPVLRQPQNGRRTGSEPQAHPAVDAHSGHRSPLSQTQLEPPGAGSPDLPVPAARRRDRAPQPRLEHRYYLHSNAWRLSLPGSRHRLVQPLRAQFGTVQHPPTRLLPRPARSRVALRPTRNLELRSGLAIYFRRFSGSAEEARDLYQHGWPWPRAGQRVHRAAVAFFEVRTDLSRRLRHRPRAVPVAGKLFPLLQSPASASGAGLSDADRPIPAPVPKEEVVVMMGDAVPQPPWDLPLLFSRMEAFCFTRNSACRTIEN